MIRRLLSRLFPWETNPLKLSDAQTQLWLMCRHDAFVEILWRGEKYRESRTGWMLR